MKLEWTDRAVDDLTDIGDFIAQNSQEHARAHVEKLINKIKQVIKFPESGRIVPEYRDPELREIIVENYRIVYKINKPKKIIYVVTIFESHSLLSKKSAIIDSKF